MKNNVKNLESIALFTRGNYKCFAAEVLTLSAAPTVNRLASVPDDATFAKITVEANNPALATDASRLIRYYYHGPNPTASNGAPACHLDEILLNSLDSIERFRALIIDTGTATITLQVQYYK